ncbi:MAG: hypothetical protein ACRD1E_04400 [Terriglobales bacterium]
MTADSIAAARCAVHGQREAAALCRGCGHAYCRECVTEAQGIVWCASCLDGRWQAASGARNGRGRWLGRLGLGAAALLVLDLLWTALLQFAASIPAQYLFAGRHGH